MLPSKIGILKSKRLKFKNKNKNKKAWNNLKG